MLKLKICLYALLFVRTIDAQSLSLTVVNTSGRVIQNTDHILEWSLGELAVSTLTSPNNQLTQGFLQPGLITTGTAALFDESRLSVFPNPVSDWLNFQTDLPDIKTVRVHNASGKLVMQNEFQPMLDIHKLESGAYVVALFNRQNQFLYSFKINKI